MHVISVVVDVVVIMNVISVVVVAKNIGQWCVFARAVLLLQAFLFEKPFPCCNQQANKK